jgi:hypothetical protein
MVGRILGGIATSLLFSAFESWLVAEHNKVRHYFADELSSADQINNRFQCLYVAIILISISLSNFMD